MLCDKHAHKILALFSVLIIAVATILLLTASYGYAKFDSYPQLSQIGVQIILGSVFLLIPVACSKILFGILQFYWLFFQASSNRFYWILSILLTIGLLLDAFCFLIVLLAQGQSHWRAINYELEVSLQDVPYDKYLMSEWDSMQQTFKCCGGGSNYKDWTYLNWPSVEVDVNSTGEILSLSPSPALSTLQSTV